MIMVLLMLAALATAAAGGAAAPVPPARWLSDRQACALARSMEPRPARLAPLACEPQPLAASASVPHPEWFLAYQLIAPDAPESASVNRGFYAVNRATGDTWELVLCKHVTSPAIGRARARLRRASGLSEAAWAAAVRWRPCEPV